MSSPFDVVPEKHNNKQKRNTVVGCISTSTGRKEILIQKDLIQNLLIVFWCPLYNAQNEQKESSMIR